MPNHGKGGRPPKPIEDLKLAGTYRKDRHGKRGGAQPATGTPIKPEGLDPDAERLWDMIVPSLVERGVVGLIDTPHLWAMVEAWGLYRIAFEKARQDPIDKNTRIALSEYKDNFDRAAAKCGLSPADRERLTVKGLQPAQAAKQGVLSRKR